MIHASYTAPLFLLTPPAASPAQLLLLWTVFTAVFVAVVVGLVRREIPLHLDRISQRQVDSYS